MFNIQSVSKRVLAVAVLTLLISSASYAQFKNVYMAVGSIHNWYSEIGCELESAGFVASQQDGLQWPAIYRYQDMQAMKGMWIGSKNFTDESGTLWPTKVVTVGPRPPAFYAAFPMEFKRYAKFKPTEVFVDGNFSYGKDVKVDEIDPTLKFDQMLNNVVNTEMGITITRKILASSQQFHDNYIVYEYEFKNTGNTDTDAAIELPNQTVTDFYAYFMFRYAVNKQTRFVIGNSTGWGYNTMNDARGDGANVGKYGDPATERYRTQFAWHGNLPVSEKQVPYDNIGGPIQQRTGSAVAFLDAGDTLGRLGATQFVGNITLHADKSPTDQTDDATQPATTDYQDSDLGAYKAGNDSRNSGKMEAEYALMTRGNNPVRHARVVQADGNYAAQTASPNLGKSGGISSANGYGPYTLAPGQSVKIVWAEGAAGMDFATQLDLGKKFKAGTITALQKNTEVMKGKDSLMKTWESITKAYQANWNIPQAPFPPLTFDINSGGDGIFLKWTQNPADPNPIDGWLVYRALSNFDSTYYQIADLPAGTTSFKDDETAANGPKRGLNNYYYVVAYRNQAGDAATNTPAGRLMSGRYYTQTYDPVKLKKPAGKTMSDIVIVPNPFIINASKDVGFPDEDNKIAFYDIPGRCTIKIFTELGELVESIDHTDGSGDAFWYSTTSSKQLVASGIYIVVITNTDTGESVTQKLAIIR